MTSLSENDLLLDRYKIRKKLGSGGMATVYLAEDLEKSASVALKILNSDQQKIERRRSRFLREFEILKELHFPGVIQVFDQHVSETGAPFFSMEYVPGETLAQKIEAAYKKSENTTGISIEDIKNILIEIGEALTYVHSNKIVYCDLKPANILLVTDTENKESPKIAIKLFDFGISRLQDETPEDDSANMIGTTYYMSPEQIRGNETLDARSDIYAFGVMAFELMTGVVPFSHEVRFNVTASHLAAKVPSATFLNRETPPALDRMIHICMEKDKSGRYDTMEQVVARLRDVNTQKKTLLKFLSGIFGK